MIALPSVMAWLMRGAEITLLSNMTKDSNNYQIFENRENIGYARNFLELFTKARGEYLLVTSDEDFVNITYVSFRF